MANLAAPNGVVVSVGDEKVAGLVARGYTEVPAPTTAKAKPKKPAPSPKPSGK